MELLTIARDLPQFGKSIGNLVRNRASVVTPSCKGEGQACGSSHQPGTKSCCNTCDQSTCECSGNSSCNCSSGSQSTLETMPASPPDGHATSLGLSWPLRYPETGGCLGGPPCLGDFDCPSECLSILRGYNHALGMMAMAEENGLAELYYSWKQVAAQFAMNYGTKQICSSPPCPPLPPLPDDPYFPWDKVGCHPSCLRAAYECNVCIGEEWMTKTTNPACNAPCSGATQCHRLWPACPESLARVRHDPPPPRPPKPEPAPCSLSECLSANDDRTAICVGAGAVVCALAWIGYAACLGGWATSCTGAWAAGRAYCNATCKAP